MFNHEPEDYTCLFCSFVAGVETEYNQKQDVVFENERILAFISPKWWPNNPGNVIIIPKLHIENIYDIDDATLSETSIIGKQIGIAMRQIYGCDGISFRQHNEPHGGQDVWHYHLHVFPRWEKDNLYQNHDDKKFVSPEIRLSYAIKLREILETSKFR